MKKETVQASLLVPLLLFALVPFLRLLLQNFSSPPPIELVPCPPLRDKAGAVDDFLSGAAAPLASSGSAGAGGAAGMGGAGGTAKGTGGAAGMGGAEDAATGTGGAGGMSGAAGITRAEG